MTEFSIEMAILRINDSRTREYFSEVYSSYANGNYRSAVVMLWSVVVCDVLFKMEQLSSVYNDATAQSIIEKIEQQRSRNPKSSDWEQALISEVKTRTELLSEGEYANLEHLRNHRHLSAHPVLTNAEALFAPSKEQARAHLRNALDGLLTKPPIMSRKVLETLLSDLENVKDVLPDDQSLDRYLKSKYVDKLVDTVENLIFRDLWRIVFKCDSPECGVNRDINFRALRLLYRRRRWAVDAFIQQHAAFFSELSYEGDQVELLLVFLTEHPQVYNLLADSAKTLIRNIVIGDLDRFAMAWYLSDSIGQHLDAIEDRINKGEDLSSLQSYSTIYQCAADNGLQNKAIDMAIFLYSHSDDYYCGDKRFKNFIRPYLQSYTGDQILSLIEASRGNSQACDRRKAAVDHAEVARAYERATGNAINPREFPEFFLTFTI
jgi:hypothetical protein